MKQLPTKVREERAKAGLHLNIKKRNVITEEMYNFKIDSEIIKDFSYLGSVIILN